MVADDSQRERPPQNPDPFATTHWSLVLAAEASGGAAADAALEKLCRAYWPPLYAYVRRRVPDIHEAQDLTQAFFAQLLEKRYLANVDPQRGRFRAWLITALKHFLSKEWEKAKALKRGGGRAVISFDFAKHDSALGIQPALELTPEQLYERQWAITLLGRVMRRLQREMQRSGKGPQFAALKDFIVKGPDATYARVAAQLGLSQAAARMATSRIRGRYRQLLREEIAQTVATQEEIDDEVRQLFATFGR